MFIYFLFFFQGRWIECYRMFVLRRSCVVVEELCSCGGWGLGRKQRVIFWRLGLSIFFSSCIRVWLPMELLLILVYRSFDTVLYNPSSIILNNINESNIYLKHHQLLHQATNKANLTLSLTHLSPHHQFTRQKNKAISQKPLKK